jgi:hypothetical protein
MPEPTGKVFAPVKLGSSRPGRSTFCRGGERGYTDYPSLTPD